jgi:hypothetical protein
MRTVSSAQQLNPAAGDHAIPGDPRELEAAVRAGERSWAAFPYYEMRYGVRGSRFGSSDSAFLAALARNPQSDVDRQVQWLGRVLSARGMPQWLLERHLELMHAELCAAIPERAAEYGTLANAAVMLHRLRRGVLPDASFGSLAREFEGAVGQEWTRRLPGMGEILVSAAVDERLGIRQAVHTLETWIAEPARFPFPWRDAALRTLRHASVVIG